VTEPWAVVAGIAASVSGVAALCGLGYAGRQVRRARIVADLQALQNFFDAANERERALFDAGSDAGEQTFAFNEFMNFLEIYSTAHNHNLFGEGSEELVRHKLEDAYIELDQAKAWHPKIQKAIDRSTTFIELTKFVKLHKKEILARADERTRLLAEDGHSS
jgi:hypothetical protein